MTASLFLAYGALFCLGLASLSYVGWVKPLDRAASGLMAVGLGLLAGSLVSRGVEAGHWPLVGRYEFTLCFACSAALIGMVLEWSLDTRDVGAGGSAAAFGLMCYALFGVPVSARIPRFLPPALHSIWLQIHVISAALAYGAFAVAGMMGGLYLLRNANPLIDKPLDRPERCAWYAVGVGFPLLSVSMLSGAIWAQTAWGNYWNWDPKETWALITWLVYLLYLHARGLRGWRGRRAAWLVVAAFGVVLFTFLGVNWLVRRLQLESLHVF